MPAQAQLVTAGVPQENVLVTRVDVTDRHAVYAAAKHIESVFGHVQILVNNAGIVTGKKFLDCPDELMEKTVQVIAASNYAFFLHHAIHAGQHNLSLLDSKSLSTPHDPVQQWSCCYNRQHRRSCRRAWPPRLLRLQIRCRRNRQRLTI